MSHKQLLEQLEGHSRDAVVYALQVISGQQPACRELKQACERFIEDFYRPDDWPFYYDQAWANHACEWIETHIPHVEGRWGSKYLELQPWEKFIICNLIGWLDYENHYRRFWRAYLKICRKNGKSFLAMSIAMFLFCEGGEPGAQFYSGATSEKQAYYVFLPAWQVVRREESLREKYGLETSGGWQKPQAIYSHHTASRFMPLIGDPGDGGGAALAIADEYHEHKTDALIDAMETGMGARKERLLLIITTAGSNFGGPCYEYEVQCKQLLDGVYEDDRTFVAIWGVDDGDAWDSEESLIKANPNYGVSIAEDFLQGMLNQAKLNPRKQSEFMRKHLNIWTGASDAFVNMDEWMRCADPGLSQDQFQDEDCILSLDLASKLDFTAKIKLWSREIDGKRHYYVFPTFYLPERTVYGNDRYEGWFRDGQLIATEGEEIDFNEIQFDVEQDISAFAVQEVVYDPWRASQLAHHLQSGGMTVVEWRGTPSNATPPMREFEAALSSGRFHHPGNKVLNWMVSNVIAKRGIQDTIRPDKEKDENKIDGFVAIVQAMGRAMFREGGTEIPEDYEVTAG